MRLRHRVQVIKLLNVFERWLTQNSGVVLFISFTRVIKKSLIFSTLDEIENIWFVPLTKAHLGNSELYSKETFRKVFFLTKVTNFLSTKCFISPIIEKNRESYPCKNVKFFIRVMLTYKLHYRFHFFGWLGTHFAKELANFCTL